MTSHEARERLRRLFADPPDGIAPGTELDVRRFLRLPLPAKMATYAYLEAGEAASITEAITRASVDFEDYQRSR